MDMESLGDLVESVATELRDDDTSVPADPDIEVEVEGDELLDSDQHYVFASKIRFAWQKDDQEILDRIQAAAEKVFNDLFSDAISVIDGLYRAMRVPRINPTTGAVLKDAQNRPVWQLDPDTGRPIETLSQLSGQDLDEAIFALEGVLLVVAPEINRLRLDALYAQNASKDVHDDFWPASGTDASRQTKANTGSREARWQAYFRYYCFSTANSFLKELQQFVRRIDSIRYRQINSQL